MANKKNKFHVTNIAKPKPTVSTDVVVCKVGHYTLHDCGAGYYMLWRFEGKGVHRLVVKGRFQYYS